MYCGKCGNTIPDGYEFCMKCGTKFGFENSEDVSQQNSASLTQVLSNNKKLNKRKKLLILACIALAVIICLTVGYFVLSRDKYYIDFPRNPEFKVTVSNSITTENQILIGSFLEQLVYSFNNRESDNNGLLIDNENFKESYNLLIRQRDMASGKYKESLQPALKAYATVLFYQLEEVKVYDEDFNKLDNPIVYESTLIKSKEKIEEALAYYYE